jgi:predicted DNA-binding transcriptional regulator AlpA
MSSQSNTAPKDPKTEVTREDIAKLAGCSVSKVLFATMRDKWGFPKIIRKGPKRIQLYPKAEVEQWLKANNLKEMVFVAADRAPLTMQEKTEKALPVELIRQAQIGIKPKRFEGTGKSVRVHVPARHEYERPHPQFSTFSNSGAEHRLTDLFY